MKYLYSLIILHTRGDRNGNRYFGFRLICHKTGKMVEGHAGNGAENNILGAVRMSENGWRDDSVVTRWQVTERELFAIDYSGCSYESIREFIKARGIKLPK